MTIPIEPFDHPHLAPEVSKAIAESERAGGIWLKDISFPHEVRVQTRNTIYSIKRNSDTTWLIKGHRHYCPEWTEVYIHGSTFGGSMLKVGFIGRGMYLEFSAIGKDRDDRITDQLPEHAYYTTSQIQDVWESDEEGARFI